MNQKKIRGCALTASAQVKMTKLIFEEIHSNKSAIIKKMNKDQEYYANQNNLKNVLRKLKKIILCLKYSQSIEFYICFKQMIVCLKVSITNELWK